MNNQINKNQIIARIESELLSTLFNYVVPFIDKKIQTSKKIFVSCERVNSCELAHSHSTKFFLTNRDNLESIVNPKPKINFKDLKELESILPKNLNENIKVDKSVKFDLGNIFYSLNLKQQKNKNNNSNNYSISMKYEENQQDERLSISINNAEKELYSAEIVNKKDIKDNVLPYTINIFYQDNYAEERLTITYKQQLKNYLQQHIESKEDTSNRVPLKWLNILPETMMGGVLGFTYLGENFMARRADLVGETSRMVDIHESIHTPDEYETRVLTSWIMEKVMSKYIR